ncbi:hypothetical protein, conserved [Eimeria maxima]|uniref:Uncharacterized protein n=1 Tax=Eimeria maxima TaxID=5804 RepID=U6LYM0_EIMMA|nr:hypothetical protein, conserved [Eimeria maxima]CDJ55973.1 hypothetical protein, conserved [Eimeria maxima]
MNKGPGLFVGEAGLSPLFSTPADTSRRPASSVLQKRFLGNEVRGPDFDPLDVKTWALKPHIEVVSSGLFRRANSYGEFKEFCESLRLLLFVFGSAGIATDLLFFHPTRSAYWRSLSPLRWPGLLLSQFRGSNGTGGDFDFEKEGMTTSPDGIVRTAAYAAFERAMR